MTNLEIIWRDFLESNPDGVTSPDDMPDHALVTFDQFKGMVEQASTRELVRDFNIAFGRPVNDRVVPLTVSERELLGKILFEEVVEYLTFGLGLEIAIEDYDGMKLIGRDPADFTVQLNEGQRYDPIESADGLGDINVVIHFASLWHGFDLDKVTAHINDSNMSKLGEDGKAIINGNVECDECDGRGLLSRDPDELDTCGKCGGEGRFIRDPDKPVGKILKGPGFWKPDIDSQLTYSEEMCPDHVASKDDAKICGRCGIHIDSLRPGIDEL